MVNNMKEFKAKVKELREELESVYNKRLLNNEGIQTLIAYDELLNIMAFYDNLKDFAGLVAVKNILEKYNDCKEIRHIRWFLEKVEKDEN